MSPSNNITWISSLAVLALASSCVVIDNRPQGGWGGAGGTAASSNTSATSSSGGSGGSSSDGGGGSSSDGGGGGSSICNEHADCTVDELCITDSCEWAYNRDYVFTVLNGKVPATNQGSDWDLAVIGFSTAEPDPYVAVSDSGSVMSSTSIQNDTYSPAWNEDFIINLQKGGGDISFQMYDSDVATDDFIGSVTGTPTDWLSLVQNNDGNYSTPAAREFNIVLKIVPQ